MCRYFFFLLWSNIIFGLTVFLFQRGFLLSREVLADKTKCEKTTKNDSCYAVPREYSKAIVLIIDALRYDFAAYDKNLSMTKPYQNAMPIINQLIEKGQGKLYQSFADPPTTTMQRLKGLTTGSIPTFIDVSANFASYEINEDNIIDQLIERGRKVVFAGDDTWLSLFPNRFTRTYPFPSFDVWDLDTVDRGVEKHLFQELHRPQNWDVFIGHFLGVDHAGHKFGPTHAEMRRKLTEMNTVIAKTVEEMPKDCVLFVMGDHGMTNTGDHGGDSDDELNSALFMYSNNMDDDSKNVTNRISQVDFVPTFSLLMGLPIPFSNIGKVISDVTNGLRQLQYLKINIDQVFTYLSKYQTNFGMDVKAFDAIEGMKTKFQSKKVINPHELPEVLNLGLELLNGAKSMCQSMFVDFDLNNIWMGLTVSGVHICLMILLSLDKIFLRTVVNSRLFLCLTGSFVIGTCVSHFFIISQPLIISGILLTLPVCGLSILWRIRYSIGQVLLSIIKNTDQFSLSHIGLYSIVCLALYSNSYVVEEAQVLYFATTSLMILHLLRSQLPFKNFKSSFCCLLFLGLLRLTNIYFRCREEQQAYCINTDLHKSLGTLDASVSSSYKNWRFGVTLFSVFSLIALPWYWLRHCGNLNGLSLSVTISNYAPAVIGLFLVFQWALQGIPEEMAAKLLPWHFNVMALVVYALSILSIVIILAKPHLIMYETSTRSKLRVPNSQVNPAFYFQQMKANPQEYFGGISSNTGSNQSKNKGIVYGLATAISAAFCSIGVFLSFICMLLLGDGLCPSVVLAMISMMLFLYVSSVHRLARAANITDLMHVPWTSVICWSMMESLFFYATGHQPTFPTIQWSAAFVGFSGANYGASTATYWLPAVLIGVNTFAARILFTFMVPLLLVAPFTVYKVLQDTEHPFLNLAPFEESLDEGETVLIEQIDEATSHMFRLCLKYSAILGLKMLASMVSAAHHRRHLMVWKIFAPRFIFEGIGFGVGLGVLCLSYLTFLRIQASLSRFHHELTKNK